MAALFTKLVSKWPLCSTDQSQDGRHVLYYRVKMAAGFYIRLSTWPPGSTEQSEDGRRVVPLAPLEEGPVRCLEQRQLHVYIRSLKK